MEKRREFIKKVTIVSGGLVMGKHVIGSTVSSYKRIVGANDRVHVAIIGLNGRGGSMAGTFAHQPNLMINTVCDVDSRTIPKVQKNVLTIGNQTEMPIGEGDVRKVMQDKILMLFTSLRLTIGMRQWQSWAVKRVNMSMSKNR